MGREDHASGFFSCLVRDEQSRGLTATLFCDRSTRRKFLELALTNDTCLRSAGFRTCCIADFPVGTALERSTHARPAVHRCRLKTGDTADWKVCATWFTFVKRRSETSKAEV